MDPIALVLSGISAATAVARSGTGNEAVKDGYAALRTLIRQRIARNSAAEIALTRYEQEPTVWEVPLKHELEKAGIKQDQAILDATARLHSLLRDASSSPIASDTGSATSSQSLPKHTTTTYAGERSGGVDINASSISVGGDLVGRDKTVTMGLSKDELDRLFVPLYETIQHETLVEKRPEAAHRADALKAELSKGSDADDQRVARLLDDLVTLVPSGVSALTSIFATPILAGVTGPVTSFVLNKIRAR